MQLAEIIRFFRSSLLASLLLIFMIWGLVTRLIISIYLRLDSDAVGMGLMSMEIGKHNNYLLAGYHLLSSDSLVFTELAPFQLLPQILTGYHPTALKIMVFFIFLLSILAAAYLIWHVSGNVLAALLFGALAANIPPGGYYWLAYPTSHNATILFGLAILIIVFHLTSPAEDREAKPKKTGRTKTRKPDSLPWTYSLFLVVLVFLSVFSDTLVIIWALVPCCIACLLYFRGAVWRSETVVGNIAVTAIMAYILKTYGMPGWIPTNYSLNSLPAVFFVNLPLFFKAQLLFLNQGLSAFIGRASPIGPVEVLSAVFFFGVIGYSLKEWWHRRRSTSLRERGLSAILILSILLTGLSFLVSGYAYDIGGARYLTFTALALLMLVALYCPVSDKICVFFVLGLLVVSAVAGGIVISTVNTSPNEREYGLIGFLKDRNQNNGYGTYWNANVITYLSAEEVTIRSTNYLPDTLQPDLLNSCDRWFTTGPDRYFLIYDSTRPADAAQKNYPLLVAGGNRSRALHYRQFEISPMNSL